MIQQCWNRHNKINFLIYDNRHGVLFYEEEIAPAKQILTIIKNLFFICNCYYIFSNTQHMQGYTMINKLWK